jgi:glycosyltransferase involved in cell wall biosynthesis
MQEADVLMVIDADVPDSVFLPSKLIDYLGAGRPVLGITPPDSGSARVIRKAGGWVVAPADQGAFGRTLQEILSAAKNGALERSCPPKAVRDEYAIENHARQAAAMIDAMIGRTSA